LDIRGIKKYLNEGFKGSLEERVPLAEFTTFRIGGPADILAFPKGFEDVLLIAQAVLKSGTSFMVLGRGSNVLVSDQGYRGVMIVLSGGLGRIIREGKDELYVESGCDLNRLISRCIDEEMGGLEDLVGIPGTVGGAVRMNAGAHGTCMADLVQDIGILRLQEGEVVDREISARQIGFEYRESAIKDNEIIYKVRLKLNNKEKETLEERRRKVLQWRKENQPLRQPCAGSVFRNPEGVSAWELIDRCGMKGKRIGDAMISEKHANFIVNTGKATAADVYELIACIKDKVYREEGIVLKEEIRYIGEIREKEIP
jgi:UDP-N-acetylmuramate dehydrogenase